MPQLFTPKFVDMVRVYSSTQGTGPLVCGTAVPGFASFAESVSVGDSFYYSIQGVDKPQEREVGRGILQANGTISRQPLKGSLTNFTSGSKTIALVAASEWFAAIHDLATSGSSGGGTTVATRIDPAATTPAPGSARCLAEAGREGMFFFDGSDLSAMVAADPGQAIFIAPATAPTGASGAWVRRFSGSANAQWWGFLPGSGDVSSKLVAALATLKAMSTSGFGYGKASIGLYIPASKQQYAMGSTTVEISHALRLHGDSSELNGASILSWSGNVTGLRLLGANTAGAQSDYVVGSGSASGTIIEHLSLSGAYSGSEIDAHGIQLRATAVIRDCLINGFAGNGVHAEASAGAPGYHGNVNLWRMEGVLVQNCRNGFYFNGADANGGVGTRLNAIANRRWGIFDSAFLGNTYVACHMASNGRNANSPNGACIYNGNLYAVNALNEAGASTNPPSGTTAHNAYWYFLAAGQSVQPQAPAWVSGTQTFAATGAYRFDDGNSNSVLSGCYSEGDQWSSQIDNGPVVVIGGLHAADPKGNGQAYGGWIRASGNGLMMSGGVTAGGASFLNGGTEVTGKLTVKGAVGYIEIQSRDTGNPGTFYNTGGVTYFFQGGNVAGFDSGGINLQAGKVLKVSGTQVVGPRQGGWTAATGTASRGAFAAAAAGTASATYVQGELQGALTRVASLEARLVALETDVRAHGLIN